MTWFRLKACPKCQGDLASDEGYWLCLQCGTYYYTGLYNGSEPNWACRPVSGPEAGGQPNGLLTSPTKPGGRNGPDYPPQRQEKSLAWSLVVTPDMAGPSPILAAVLISPANLAMRRQ